MKLIHLIAVLAFLSSASAHARIGETFDEVCQRYGKPEEQQSNRLAGTKKYYFVKSGIGVEVMILNDKSVMEIFHRTEGATSDADIQEILKANADGHRWAFDNRSSRWTRSDVKVDAYREPGSLNFLWMQDIAAVKQAAKDAKANPKSDLSGF